MPDEFKERVDHAIVVAILALAAFFVAGPKLIHWFIAAARWMGAN